MNRHRNLDEIERVPDSPWLRNRPARPTDDLAIPTLGTFGYCWCGDNFGHDWPGKDKGMPHPRSSDG